MQDDEILRGKRILIVDDEPDILETLEELLSECLIDTAPNFESGSKFLDKCSYDVTIFDIMGVKGYDLLRIASQKGIPTLMLTAHALSPENLVKSIREGAHAYIPKDKLSDITKFVKDVLESHEEGTVKHGYWFNWLRPFFDRQFGPGWREKNRDFWEDFDAKQTVTRQELEEMM